MAYCAANTAATNNTIESKASTATCFPVSVTLRAFANLLETRIIFTYSPYICDAKIVANPLKSFLAATPELRSYALQITQLGKLQRQYESIVPASLKRCSRVLQYQQNAILLAADNGSAAAKLKQLAPELISLFRARGCEVTGIQIRVQVASRADNRQAEPRQLSPSARTALQELESDLQDTPLRAALRRLARH